MDAGIRCSTEHATASIASTIVANVVAARQEWEEGCSAGARIAAALCNELIESSFTGDSLNWGVLKSNRAVQHAVLAKMKADRLKLANSLLQVVGRLHFMYSELKELLAQLEPKCDHLAWSKCQLPRAPNAFSIFELEELLDVFVSDFGKDVEVKRRIAVDLMALSENPDRFGADTRDDLLIYLTTWSQPPWKPASWIDQALKTAA